MAPFQNPNAHHSVAGDNAMTEIALALAMGFFAIMILTLVSMGAGTAKAPEVAAEDSQNTAFISAALAPAKSDQSDQPTALSTAQNQDQLVIYYKGQFMDAEMQPVSVETLSVVDNARVILALSPNLPMSEAMDVRSQVPAEQLVISALDDRWLDRLAAEFGQD